MKLASKSCPTPSRRAFIAGAALSPFFTLSCREVSAYEYAPNYDDRMWNGAASYPALLRLYTQHRESIESITAYQLKYGGYSEVDVFYRTHFSEIEKALNIVRLIAEQENINSLFQYLDISLSERNNLMANCQEFISAAQKLKLNNCYAYMVNNHHGDYNQPGARYFQSQNHTYVNRMVADNFSAYVDETITGLHADGVVFSGKDNKARPNHYLGALLVQRVTRYYPNDAQMLGLHFLRQDSNGLWSHKFGPNIVTNLDYSGKVIVDPRQADLRPHIFIGFAHIPQGGLAPTINTTMQHNAQMSPK